MRKIFGDKNVEVIRDLDLNRQLSPSEYSHVFSVGGDGTLVRTASFIDNAELPLVGVCSDHQRSRGKLTGLNLGNSQEQVD